MQKVGQIILGKFGISRYITDIAAMADVVNIVEIGTWNGMGSTRCILEGLKNKSNYIFKSYECSKEMYHEAIDNNCQYLCDKFNIVNGKIVDERDISDWFDVGELNSEQKSWMKIDIERMSSVENVIDTIPSNIDLLVLDGGEFSTYKEWLALKDRTKYIVLDDTLTLKSKKIRQEIIDNKSYHVIDDCLKRKKWLFGCEAKGLMKNLIYTIVTKNYEPILNLFLTSITRHTKFDICCITDSVCSSTHIYNCPNFDSKFDARFRIGEWENSKNYDNFLYLDVDILCQKDIGIIFEIIDSNKDCLHCVKELGCLNKAGFYHTFSGNIFDDSCPAYNSGTFGFNKKILPLFNEFLIYINENRHLAICDQPLFNEFFTKKNILVSTLSPYVYLMNDNLYRNVNPTNLEDVVFRHYLGDYGKESIKLLKMESDLKTLKGVK